MPIDDLNRVRVRNRHMIRLYPHHFAVFLVRFVHDPVSLAATGAIHEPETTEFGGERTRDLAETGIADVWEYEVQDGEEEEDVDVEEVGEEHGSGCVRLS